MRKVSTLYKFKTPFFHLETEKYQLLRIISKFREFFEFQSEEFSYQEKNTDLQQFYLYVSNFFRVEIAFSQDIDNIFIPILMVDISYNTKLLSSDAISAHMSIMFEIFDGMNEKKYILERDEKILSTRYFQHDFIDVDILFDKYQTGDKIESIFDSLVKQAGYTEDDFYGVQELFLYLSYVLFRMHLNMKDIVNIKNTDMPECIFFDRLALPLKRLEYLENQQQVYFLKYLNFLEKLYSLFG